MTLIRLFFFTILVPGSIAWWIPSALSRQWQAQFDIAPWNNSGIALIVVGALFYFRSAFSFLIDGKGTPAIWFTRPIKFLLGEEPGILVSGGFYTKTRNPMYLGVVTCVFGEAVFFERWILIEYSAILWLFFHSVIIFMEEPHLRKKHGMPYEQYLRSVPRWISFHRSTHANQALMNLSHEDIIFLGDSITEGCDWANLFHDPRIKNHGIGGDTSDGVRKRLDPIVSAKPVKLFLMVGINDLWNGISVKDVVANYRHILTQCKTITPTTTLFIQSVLPMNGAWSSPPARVSTVNAQVVALNNALRKLASEFRYSYIDLHSVYVREGQLDPQCTSDGLHLNDKAYMIWKAVIQNLILNNP